MSPNIVDLGVGEVLDQPEVEERHPAAGLEQVVARVRVAVEGAQPVEAAEHEAVDRLGGQVALGLVPRRPSRRSGRPRPARSSAPGRSTGSVTTSGTWMKGWSRYESAKSCWLRASLLVVELLDEPGAELLDQRAGLEARERQAHGAEHAGPPLSRSASMASSTPGYCTFTATARPSWVMARWTWPIDADASGTGSHSAKAIVGRGAELALDDAGGQLGRHGRRVLLQLGQRVADVVGQPDVEVRRHLAQLHEGALHAAERLGDLLGRAQLELLVELGLALGRGEHPAGPVDGEAGAGPAAHPGQLGAALAAGAGHHRGSGRRRPGGVSPLRSARARRGPPGEPPPRRPPRPRPAPRSPATTPEPY